MVYIFCLTFLGRGVQHGAYTMATSFLNFPSSLNEISLTPTRTGMVKKHFPGGGPHIFYPGRRRRCVSIVVSQVVCLSMVCLRHRFPRFVLRLGVTGGALVVARGDGEDRKKLVHFVGRGISKSSLCLSCQQGN